MVMKLRLRSKTMFDVEYGQIVHLTSFKKSIF